MEYLIDENFEQNHFALPSTVARNHRGLFLWCRQNCVNLCCSTTGRNLLIRGSLKMPLHWSHVLSMNTAFLIGKLSSVYCRRRVGTGPLLGLISCRWYLSKVLLLLTYGNSLDDCNRRSASNTPFTCSESLLGKINICFEIGMDLQT